MGKHLQPLELRGRFTGYNNEETMQVGLWITNDGEHIGAARAAARRGPRELYLHLRAVLRYALSGSAPGQVRYVLSEQDIERNIDWAQVAYALLDELEDPESRAACARMLVDYADHEAAEDNECPGHLSLRGQDMGVTVQCDGSCVGEDD